MKNKTKYLVAILLMLISFLLIGATNVNAKTITVENEEELINASKGIDSEINEIKLAKDITLTKSLKFHVVNDITLELNGCSLDTFSLKFICFFHSFLINPSTHHPSKTLLFHIILYHTLIQITIVLLVQIFIKFCTKSAKTPKVIYFFTFL